MKRYLVQFVLSAMCYLSSAACIAEEQLPAPEGPYLGQQPPGIIPKVFAPGYVSTRHRDHSVSFTPDLKELYFSRKDIDTGKWWIIQFKQQNKQWKQSIIGPRVGRPILSPDGNTLHLGSKYITRTPNGWSEIKSLGPLIDRDDWGIMRLSSSADGTYIFDDYKNNDVLRISKVKHGKRQPAELLGPKINAGMWTAHPFIAADGSYIIWDSEKEDGYGDTDLYVSFLQKDGHWGDAINLGETINTDGIEAGGYVSPDGKYFFFNRTPSKEKIGTDHEGDVYWVDIQAIEKLRHE
ncbi:hypothetical protein ACSLBF_10200 [Pseudoalteromonas sp. T1lg65]|uniref:hypothetical protein n=1 Tax=Pseudoalteromonas sp. T1lg65 TaxID=2077101 RepID=UPI003F78B99E